MGSTVDNEQSAVSVECIVSLLSQFGSIYLTYTPMHGRTSAKCLVGHVSISFFNYLAGSRLGCLDHIFDKQKNLN